MERSEGSFVECRFIENSEVAMVAGSKSDVTIIDCDFHENHASVRAGAIYLDSVGAVIISGCRFSQNAAVGEGGAVRLGQSPHLQLADLTPIIVENCIFNGNSAATGGAIYSMASVVEVKSCAFYGNQSQRGSAVLSVRAHLERPGRTEVSNCILWDEGDSEIASLDDSPISVDYSNVYGGRDNVYDPCGVVVWGMGNLNSDPLFADPNNGDFHLRSRTGRWYPNSQIWVTDSVTSPCIDAGDPMSPIGFEPFPNGGRINIGAYGGTAEASKSWFGGPVCEAIVAGDINGDCKVDFKDFAILALHWLEDGR